MSEKQELQPLTDEQIAQALLDLGDPEETLEAAARATGLGRSTAQALLRRLRAQHSPLINELRTTNSSELTGILEDRIWRALQYLDDFNLAKAPARDLAVIVGILLEKRQLLRGEPTHILSTTERANLNELVPLMVKEAQRRGIEFMEGVDYHEVEQVDQARAVRPRSARTGIKDLNRKQLAAAKEELGEP